MVRNMEASKMALDLHERSLPQVFSGGVSVDNMTWWFWIKAGMGLTIGFCAIYAILQTLWLLSVRALPQLVLLRMLRVI
jgi:hypothetical protein